MKSYVQLFQHKQIKEVYLFYFSFFIDIFPTFFHFRLELRSLEMTRIVATLKALVEVMEALSNDADPVGVGRLIKDEVPVLKTFFFFFLNLLLTYWLWLNALSIL